VSSVAKSVFGTMPDGTVVDAYTLTNASGMSVAILTYGGTLQQINVPDRDGSFANVTLGFDNLESYRADSPYFGAVIGRYANRIRAGRFTLDGVTYQVPVNNGVNSLHGGTKGFDKVVWGADPIDTDGQLGLKLTCVSPDGDQGFPGALSVELTYLLTDGSGIDMRYRATTDKPTVCNLTNHAYFNLAGEGNGDVLGHEVMINADHYLPVDDTQIPTGEIAAVAGTPLDFTSPHAIGERIRDGFAQLFGGRGYDHNYVLKRSAGDVMTLAARCAEPISGRVLEVSTTEPGMQFYTGGFLLGTFVGTSGRTYRQGDAFASESQHFPDSPNQPSFPSVVLRPGEVYESRTTYVFSTD
jgi:aldose 1-epimerase